MSPAIRKQSRPHLSPRIVRISASTESAWLADKFCAIFHPPVTVHRRFRQFIIRFSPEIVQKYRIIAAWCSAEQSPRELGKQLFSLSRSPPDCVPSLNLKMFSIEWCKRRWWRCQCSLECMSRYNHQFEALLLGSPFPNIADFESHTSDDSLASIEAS